MADLIRIVVGEDHALIREGVVHVLDRAGFEVVGVAGDAVTLTEMALAERPNIVLTDIQMPPDNLDDGLRAALEIRAVDRSIGVIILSQFLEYRYATQLMSAGAQGVGYLLKEKVASSAVLVDAVHRVADGGSALDPDVIAGLVGRKRPNNPLGSLTRRELDVLGLMAEGRSNTSIAQHLVVTVPAVERHVTGIFTKLGLPHSDSDQHRRVTAVLTYLHR